MELGEPDASGRRRPIPVEGSNFTIECDMAIVAIGNGPNPIIFDSTPDMKLNKWGYIQVDDESTNETTKAFVYAGGDIVTGAATVIEAMGAGRIAAKAMHEKLTSMREKPKAKKAASKKKATK
jgi:glutamate synthase (NADPH/NADH) small chain